MKPMGSSTVTARQAVCAPAIAVSWWPRLIAGRSLEGRYPARAGTVAMTPAAL